MKIYYNTVDDVVSAGITDCLVYINDLHSFFYVNNGKVEVVQTQPVADSVEELKNYGSLNEQE
jgi:hypothetical protein